MTPPKPRIALDEHAAIAYKKSLEAHIAYVREAGEKLGVSRIQLLNHDRSKWSQWEFPYYAMHFHADKTGKSAEELRAIADGFAGAWLHHLQVNKHHWQSHLFPDNWAGPQGSTVEAGAVRMPSKFVLEMVADWMGSEMAYQGRWDMTDWLTKNIPRIRLHSRTAREVKEILHALDYGPEVLGLKFLGERP